MHLIYPRQNPPRSHAPSPIKASKSAFGKTSEFESDLSKHSNILSPFPFPTAAVITVPAMGATVAAKMMTIVHLREGLSRKGGGIRKGAGLTMVVIQARVSPLLRRLRELVLQEGVF